MIPSRLDLSKQLKVKVGSKNDCLSSDEEIQSLDSDGGAAVDHQDEVFSKKYEILPFLFPALGCLLFGYDIGAISGVGYYFLQSPKLSWITWFKLTSIHLDLVIRGSIYGALVSSVLVYPIADFLGRRRQLIIAAMLYLLGGLATSLAPSLNVLILGRLIYGLGIGLATHGAPLYIAETCPSQRRGTLILMKELTVVLGILVGFAGCLVFDGVRGWRYLLGLTAPVAVLMGLGMWSLPASPRWLLLRAVQGKASLQECKEGAVIGLSRLRGRLAGDKVYEKQVEEILVSLTDAYADSFWEVLRGLSFKALTITGGLVLFLQITEHPGVLYYAGSIRQTYGFAAASVAARVLAVVGVLKILMTEVAVLKADYLVMVSLLFCSAYNKIHRGCPVVAVGALLMYLGCYQISFVPISWLMVSEFIRTPIREGGIIAGLANLGASAIAFAFSLFKIWVPIRIGLLAWVLFAIISLVFILSVVFIVPETKG